MEQNLQLYESNFKVADLYEAWALYVFAELVTRVIRKEMLIGFKHMNDDLKDIQASAASDRLRKDWGIFSETTLQQQDSVSKVTIQGIYWFVFMCVAQSGYTLALLNLGFEKPSETVNCYLVGAGFIASSAAIGNVVGVEQKFHKQLEAFKPFEKFLGAKILVSFSFMQSAMLA